jgi:hypothetical protein
MRPYGTPRVFGINNPDKGDIKEFARKSSVGSIGRNGEYRGLHKNKAAKAATRRIYKRRARAENKAVCRSAT